ncbi:MAG: CHAT domain-containing protein [Acidimicrobiia bacterium]|nr:CHAT domain-containing protein [Acidimicrobiia bacterium]
MPERRYEDFDLLVEGTGDAGYRARVLDSPAGQASADFSAPFNDIELENFLLRIGRPRRGVRRLESPELEAAREFGAKLFDAVFAGPVGDALRRSIDDADREGAGLRIRLRLSEAPELGNVPWEYLFSATNDRFLVLSAWTPIVRYLDLPSGTAPLTVASPLRVLVVIASPTDFPPLDVEREWNRLSDSVSDLESRGLVVMDRLEHATLLDLQRQLRRKDYHILHFVGHGGFDERADDGVLMFVDDSGRAKLVTGRDLGTILHDHRSLRLAVLNACEGARTATDDPFAGSAQNLVRQGIPAVVAMQFEITDGAAITFAHELYQAVSEGFPIDAALAEARRAIFGSGNDIEWGTPVLYMRSTDGLLFDVDHTAATIRPADQVPTKPAEEPPLPLPLSTPLYRGAEPQVDEPPAATAAPEEPAVEPPVSEPAGEEPPAALEMEAPPIIDEPSVATVPPEEPAVEPPVSEPAGEEPQVVPVVQSDVATAPIQTKIPQVVVEPPSDSNGPMQWFQSMGLSPRATWALFATLGALIVIVAITLTSGEGDVPPTNAPQTTTEAQQTTTQPTTTQVTTTDANVVVPPPTDGDALAIRVDTPPTIDGVGSEYGLATAHPVPHTIFTHPDVLSGDVARLGSDATATIQIGWDDRALYVFASVVDDVVSQPNSGNQIWHGDAVNLNVAFSGVGLAASERPAGSDFQLTLSPGDSSAGTRPGSVLFIGNGQAFSENFVGVADVAAVRTADGYTLEASVPWTTFGLADPPGSTIGAILTIFDNDGEIGSVGGTQGTLQTAILSNTADAGFQRPQTWGLLRFTG